MQGKKLIKILHQMFRFMYYLNIVLIGGVFGVQLFNIIRPEKALLATYLGKFSIELSKQGTLQSDGSDGVKVFFDKVTGFPDVVLNSNWHVVFILLFVVFVAVVTLFYNYQLYTLFKQLNLAIKEGTPFSSSVMGVFRKIALFSILIFVVGMLLSVAKLIWVDALVFDGFVAKPVFDNQFLNFLWIALASYIFGEIYKVGLELKNEQDLTI